MDMVSITTSYLPNISYYLLALLMTILSTAYYYVETNRVVRFSLKLPHPPRIPIIGHTLLTLRVSPEDIVTQANQYFYYYGTVFSVHFGTRTIVFLNDAQDIEIILNNSVHLDKSVDYIFFKPWLGEGMLTNTGAKWRKHRKVIAPTFHTNIVKTFLPLFYKNSLDLVKQLRNKVGKQFDCYNYISAVTAEILMQTAMGVKKEMKQNIEFDYTIAIKKMTDIIHRRHYDISLRMDFFFKFSKLAKLQQKLLHTIHSLAENLIQEKWKDIGEKQEKAIQGDQFEAEKSTENIKDNKNTAAHHEKLYYIKDNLDDIDENNFGKIKRLPFLETLLNMKKNGGQMTDEEIFEEVNSIMFGGHETTTSTSCFTLCVLGSLPEIQACVHEELDSIFGDSDRQCTFQDTVKMKYLERVILETLRLFPTAPIIARRLNEDVRIVTGNYVLPKNITVMMSQLLLHRSEKHYSNPLVFDPDNFLPEKMQQRHYYAYIPFSAGPRSCLGRQYAMLNLKVLLSTILRNYHITSDVSYQNFILRADVVLKKTDGFNIKIEPRKPMF